MKKLLYLIILSCFLSSCASYKPQTQEGVDVTFYFEGNGKSALTFWRRIDENGKVGKRFAVGGNEGFALFFNSGFRYPYSTTLKLDPGTYYLDSYQVVYDNGFVVSEGGHYMTRNGWDKENNKPIFLSFKVKKGSKSVTLPMVNIEVQNTGNNKAIGKFNFKDPNSIFTVGPRTNEF
ncbi:hypothetical protein ACFL0U_03910 [Pseudomonadota bacterium]